MSAAVFVLAGTRALAYAPIGAAHSSPGPALISGHGAYIGYWVIGWGLVCVAAFADMITDRYDCVKALSAMMGAWGGSYLLAWVISGFEQMGWLTTFTYWCPAIIVICLLKIVQILEEVVTECWRPLPTGSLPSL